MPTPKKKKTATVNPYDAQAAAVRAQAAKHKDPKVRAAMNAQATTIAKIGKRAAAK